MTRPTRIASTLLSAVLAVTIAACGGGSSNNNSGGSGQLSTTQFKQQFKALDADIQAAGGQIAQAIQSAEQGKANRNQLGATFSAAHQRVSSDLDKIQALKAPAQYKGDVSRYVSALRPVDADLQKITAAINAHSGPRAKAGVIQLFTDSAKGKAVASAVRRKLGIKQG